MRKIRAFLWCPYVIFECTFIYVRRIYRLVVSTYFSLGTFLGFFLSCLHPCYVCTENTPDSVSAKPAAKLKCSTHIHIIYMYNTSRVSADIIVIIL